MELGRGTPMRPLLEETVRGYGICALMLPFFLLAGAQGAGAQTYTTNFPNTENPISEGGKWIDGKAVGIDWGDISTTPGQTHDHSGTARFADATALLTGTWGPDQTAQATVYAGSVSGAPEVELRLRSSLSPHQCTGYEISNSVQGGSNGSYLIIVRWNGPLANFTYLANLSGAQYAVTTGDVVKATIVGNVITSYKNGVQMAQVTDNTYSTGNPGMGFNEGTNGTYGFTSFTATSAGSAVAPTITIQPTNVTVTAGQTATFTVTASGTAPISYQWQHESSGAGTWNNVGTNSASITTAPTVLSDSGSAYRVVVTNPAGGVTSNPATLTVNPPAGGALPAPWTDQDIGTVGVAGSATVSGGTFTANGGGADIWGGSDQFNFISQPLAGDADIVARVAGLGNTNGWAKAGVMIRQSLAADSSYAFTAMTPVNGCSAVAGISAALAASERSTSRLRKFRPSSSSGK